MLILFTLREISHLSAYKILLIPSSERVNDVVDESHNRTSDAVLLLRHNGRGVAAKSRLGESTSSRPGKTRRVKRNRAPLETRTH